MGNGRSTARSRRKSTMSRIEEDSDETSHQRDQTMPTISQIITVDVVVKDQKETCYHLQIQPETKIEHLKIILLAKYGVSLNQNQLLFFNGIETEDEKTLLDYDLSSGNSFQICSFEQNDNSPEDLLIDAAQRGDLQTVKHIIASGFPVNAPLGVNGRSAGCRALHEAVDGGRTDVLRYLLRAGVFVDDTDEDGLTALHVAASSGNMNDFELLLRGGADMHVKAQGMNVMHFAAAGGNLMLLQFIERTCDITETTDDNLTALHLAAIHGNLETVLWLVERGSNINIRDGRGRTAEDLARVAGHTDVAIYLYRQMLLQQQKFLHAAAEGNLESVLFFCKIGVDVECKTPDEGEYGHRASHAAALYGHTEVLKAILNLGTKGDAEDDMGSTPMHYAATGGQIGSLKLLKNEGCKVCVCNNLNMTPLHFAAETGELAASSWLLAQGVQPNITSTTGFTAIDMAEGKSHYALVDIIRKHQAMQKLMVRPADIVNVEKTIGIGTFGQVFLATMNNRHIVIKKIMLNDARPGDIEIVEQELLQLKHLHHPNIVTYMGIRIQHKHLQIMMEYCKEGNLAQRISQQRAGGEPFEEKRVLNWISKIASALYYLHGRKVLHGNLKPKNILFSKSGAIKLGDVGLSTVIQVPMFAGSYAGNQAYMSPEVLRNAPYDEKAEMWSYGCLLHELGAYKDVTSRHKVEIPGIFSQQYKQLVASLRDEDPTKRPSSFEVTNLPFLKMSFSAYLDLQFIKESDHILPKQP